MKPGSIKAIAYEIKNGDVFTVLDEILHAFDFIIGNFEWRAAFCWWAHERKDN